MTQTESRTESRPAQVHRLVPEETTVRFTTRHLFGLSGVAGSVRLVRGHVVVDADGALLGVEAELDMASFDSASSARDQAVASPRFLDSKAHPVATYRSLDVERRTGGWLVHGELTARGTAAPVDLLVDDAAPEGTVHATARVDRVAHGITIPTAMAARHLQVDITTRGEQVAQA